MASNNPEREEERWENAGKARRWDEDRIRRFWEDQQRKREWINFAEIAEWFSELSGPAKPKKAGAARDRAYRMLEQDLLAGNFEGGGRSQVLFRCPGVSSTHARMTRQRLRNAIDSNLDGEHGRFYLKHCWLPRNLFKRWCARHHLPKSPPRFKYPSSDKGERPPTADWDSPKNTVTRQPHRERARRALDALFGSKVPDAAALPNKPLGKKVNDWLTKRSEPPVQQRTIQRAAGRK